MKKIISLIILCSFPLYANISILHAQQEIIQIAESKIEEAILLENYITRYIIRVRSLDNQYPNIEQDYIESVLQDIENILGVLRDIQQGIYSISETSMLIDGVISYMKQLNGEIQNYISEIQKKERENIERVRNEYSSKVRKIYALTSQIIDIYSRHYLGQIFLDQKDREIIAVIITLRKKNDLLIRFETQSFLTVEQMEDYLQKTLRSIRGDIIELRLQRN